MHADYKAQTYIWISMALAAPILLWPASSIYSYLPPMDDRLYHHWLLAAGTALIIAATADSILAAPNRLLQLIAATFWIVGSSSLLIMASETDIGAWLLALGFLMHSLRAIRALLGPNAQWWHWAAWIRDSSLAVVMSVWLLIWPHV